MKNILILVACLVLAAGGAGARPASAPQSDQTELGARMEKLNAPWRKLRRQVGDPARNLASLDLIAQIRAAAKDTEKLTPAKAADLPEAERAKFQAEYAAGMKKFFGQLDVLEAALKAGDNAQAREVVAAIADLQRDSHRQFRKDSDAE